MKKIIYSLIILFTAMTINAQNNKFTLLPLPYPAEALEPVISKQTVEFHHGKHLLAYVNNLNNLINGTEYENMTLEDIVAKSDGGLFNNAGQVLNHNLYFTQFSPDGGGEPSGELQQSITGQWGSFENFKKEFEKSGVSLFGSGWVWLSKDSNGKLIITQEQNGSNPVAKGLVPLLGFDVWEHSYYLDYQNRRADHLSELWKIINWKEVEARFEK